MLGVFSKLGKVSVILCVDTDATFQHTFIIDASPDLKESGSLSNEIVTRKNRYINQVTLRLKTPLKVQCAISGLIYNFYISFPHFIFVFVKA